MKRKALAMILALCMVLSMLPMNVFAAQPEPAQPFRSGDALGFHSLPAESPMEPNDDGYDLTITSTGPGYVASNPAETANAGDEVLLLVSPDPGYTALVDDHGLGLEFFYIGYHMYIFTMPACDVTLDFYFEALPGPSYNLEINADENVVWYTMNDVTSAKEGESVILFLEEREYYSFNPETDVTANCEDFYYLGYLEEEDRHVYELFMPAHDVTINISTTAEKVSHYIDVQINNAGWGSVSLESGQYAKEGDVVTFYAEPHYGYKLVSLWTDSGAEITHINGYLYSFIMPDAEETIFATFDKNINPVSVVVETGLGGTATLDVTEAQETEMVTLTCTPEVGYRIARITGVDTEIYDLGGGQYRFTMPGRAVTIQVLFLRNENPFLDINETQFFYDSVLWAAEQNITTGTSYDTFDPFSVCTRAQVVTFLWRYAGSPEPTTTEHPFTDVPAGSWFEQPVLWALENSITNGISDTEFGAVLPCNRAQVVTFLWRYEGSPEPTDTEHPFTDVEAGIWYEAPVLWALSNGITTGATTTTFNPNGECQRAQVVTFLHRTAQLAPAVYTVNAQFDETLGTVTLSHTSAAVGENVTVTAVPFRGCRLEQIWCESGTDLYPLFGADGYCFYMPDQHETVHATFVKVEPSNIPPTDPDGQLYVLDLYDGCFHDPDCVEIAQIDPWNYYEYTGLRESLVDHDYFPCNTCQP